MVRIRLRRVGKRKQPHYRVVVADQRSPRDGRFIDVIGQYNPLTEPSQIAFEEEKTLEWLRKGAKPSDSVVALLKRAGIWSQFVADKGPAPKKVKKHAKGPQVAAAKAEQPAPPTDDATGEPEPETTETTNATEATEE